MVSIAGTTGFRDRLMFRSIRLRRVSFSAGRPPPPTLKSSRPTASPIHRAFPGGHIGQRFSAGLRAVSSMEAVLTAFVAAGFSLPLRKGLREAR